MLALDNIKRLVPPPVAPVPSAHRIDADGRSLRLPSDFAALLDTYGPGAFNEWVTIFSVANPHPRFDILTRTRTTAADLQEFRQARGDDWPPYSLWPQEGALVQWGAVEIEGLYWHTKSDPDDWPVVVLRDTEQVDERLSMTATELVLGLLESPSPSQLLRDLGGPPLRFARSPARVGEGYESTE